MGAPDLFDEASLSLFRSQWRETIEGDGGRCPCCDRWGRVYGRHLNKTMVESLLWLIEAQADADGWVDVPALAPRWLVRSNQLPTLRWWSLVERVPSDDPDRKHSGLWRPTPLGRDFAAGRVRVPRTAYTYAGEVERLSEDLVSVADCMGAHFSYEETMSPGGTA